MLNEEDMKEIEEAKSNILRGNDIESAALILEKVIWDNLVIVGGRVDITKVAVRQILNFIEEYKDKGYLDVVREKVKANEEIAKLKKEIDLMAEHIVSSAIVDDTVCAIKCDCESDISEDCSHEKMLNCTKQYFETKAKKGE